MLSTAASALEQRDITGLASRMALLNTESLTASTACGCKVHNTTILPALFACDSWSHMSRRKQAESVPKQGATEGTGD
jgi:hypothetical protein